MVTIQELYKKMCHTLEQAGVDSLRRDARFLMQQATGLDEADFIASPDKEVAQDICDEIERYIKKRVAGEPVSRIFGAREFWGLEFEVTPDTLDPRPDTETLIEAVLASVEDKKAPLRIVDLGTGTGCILIALLSELPNATGVAVDVSAQALEVAKRNAERHGLSDRLETVQGSWMEPLEGQVFDLIVSNPPYIPAGDIEGLSSEVKNHDPVLALSGGKNGLECYKKIFSQIKNHLNGQNRAFLEIGFDQLESVTRLAEESNLCVCDSTPDIAGIPRVVDITRGDK